MYKCQITKAVWGDKNKAQLVRALFKNIEIPFPPFKGLCISASGYSSGEIIKVVWDCDKEQFHLATKDEVPYENDESIDASGEDIVNVLTRMGWECL